MRPALVLALSFALAAAAHAETLTVTSGDAADLQAALDTAQDGDTLEIKGVYRAEDLGDRVEGFVLANRASITIRAKGKAVLDGKAFFSKTGLIVQNVQGLTLEGLRFRNFSGDGVHMSGSSDFTARACQFLDIGDSGIEDQATQGFVVEDCRFVRCSWGLACGYDSLGTTGVSITGSRFVACSSYGIDLWSSGALVDACTFKAPEGDYGVGVREGFTGVTISNSKFSRQYNGISVDGSGHEITGNKVLKSRDNGIELLDGGGNTVTENTVTGSGTSGLYIASTGNTIAGNVLKKSKAFDIESFPAQGANDFQDNVFKTSSFP